MPEEAPTSQPQKTPLPKKRVLHKTRKMIGGCVKCCLEIFVVLLLLVLIAGGACVYFVSKGDLNVAFAKKHLENAINSEIAPYRIETGKLDVDWKNVFDRPIFRVDDIDFINPDNEKILSMEGLSFTFSRSKILTGKVRPREINVTGLDLHFVRRRDGAIQIGFVAGPSYVIYREGEGDGRATYGSLEEVYQKNLAGVLEEGFLSGLRTLNIMNSAMVFEDLEKDYALSFPDVDASFAPKGNQLRLSFDLNIQNGLTRDFIQTKLSYDRLYQELKTNLKTQNFNPFLWAALFDVEGINTAGSGVKIDSEIDVTLDNNFNIRSSDLNFEASEGKLDVPELYDAPFEFERLALHGAFNRADLTIDLDDSQLLAYGIPINISGKLPIYSESAREYYIPLKFNIAEFKMPLPEKSFPDKFEDKPIYEWLTQRVTSGTVRDYNMDLSFKFEKLEDGTWGGDRDKIFANFSFENGNVDYKPPMLPVSVTSGTAVINSDLDSMVIKAPKGSFKGIKLSDITVGIRDLFAKKKSTIDLDFNAEGELKSFFAYLSKDPINLNQKVGFDTTSVKGSGKFDAKISLSTKKNIPLEDIKIDIKSDLKNALIPKLIKGMNVSANSAKFTIKDGMMRAEGNGALDGTKAKFVWQQYLQSKGKPFKMKVEASLKASKDLRNKFGVGLEDFITGGADVDVKYTSRPDKSADLDVRADLTSAVLHYELLGYSKPVGQVGSATLTAKLFDDQIKSVENLNVTAPDLKISNARMTFQNGDLKTGSFKNNEIGETRANLELEYTSPRVLLLNIDGTVLDVRALFEDRKKGKYDGPALTIKTKVQKLLTHEDQSLSATQVYMRMLNNGDISQFEMDGRVGEGEVYIRYKPDENGSPNLSAQMEDAGAALRAFGLYENVRGGIITVTGTSSDASWNGNVSGQFLLQNFSVRKAPALAKLISAMSLPGLGQLLGNDGVRFKKLTANFKWTSRPEGALISVDDGRTSGSELGLTFSGVIDRATKTLNLNGTIVPASTLNNLIGDIPLLGPLITGGTGSLIAATYKIKGPFTDTVVRINPLSALAPGIVRKILFED